MSGTREKWRILLNYVYGTNCPSWVKPEQDNTLRCRLASEKMRSRTRLWAFRFVTGYLDTLCSPLPNATILRWNLNGVLCDIWKVIFSFHFGSLWNEVEEKERKRVLKFFIWDTRKWGIYSTVPMQQYALVEVNQEQANTSIFKNIFPLPFPEFLIIKYRKRHCSLHLFP